MDSLSPRDTEVLRLLAAGEGFQRIAYLLGTSTKTVEDHVDGICRKLGVGNQADAVHWAEQQKLIRPDGA